MDKNVKVDLLLGLIQEFVEKAFSMGELFKKQFGIDSAPVKNIKRSIKGSGIPMTGVLVNGRELVRYKFHGKGCEFTFPREIVLDIVYSTPDGDYDGNFNFFRIWNFASSTTPVFNNKELFEEYLAILEKNGKIIAAPLSDVFKERIALSIGKTVYELDEDNYFSQFDRPKYKSYKLSPEFLRLPNDM